jgi:hypothetical protein
MPIRLLVSLTPTTMFDNAFMVRRRVGAPQHAGIAGPATAPTVLPRIRAAVPARKSREEAANIVRALNEETPAVQAFLG